MSTGRSCEYSMAVVMYADDGLVVVGDDHGAAAEHVAGPHEDRVADAVGAGEGLFDAGGERALGLRDAEVRDELAEALAVFGEVDRFRRGADDRARRPS